MNHPGANLVTLAVTHLDELPNAEDRAAVLDQGAHLLRVINEHEIADRMNDTAASLRLAERHQLKLKDLFTKRA